MYKVLKSFSLKSKCGKNVQHFNGKTKNKDIKEIDSLLLKKLINSGFISDDKSMQEDDNG